MISLFEMNDLRGFNIICKLHLGMDKVYGITPAQLDAALLKVKHQLLEEIRYNFDVESS